MKKSENMPVWFRKMVVLAQHNCTVCEMTGGKRCSSNTVHLEKRV